MKKLNKTEAELKKVYLGKKRVYDPFSTSNKQANFRIRNCPSF